MSITEKYSKKNSPEGRQPTMEELKAAIRDPDSASLWITRYLQLRPELEQYLRSILNSRER